MTEDDSEWAFSAPGVIREELERHAPGGFGVGKSECLVIRQLREEDDGGRFYHVEKESGGTHLYSASAIEPTFEEITIAESENWTKDDIDEDGDGDE